MPGQSLIVGNQRILDAFQKAIQSAVCALLLIILAAVSAGAQESPSYDIEWRAGDGSLATGTVVFNGLSPSCHFSSCLDIESFSLSVDGDPFSKADFYEFYVEFRNLPLDPDDTSNQLSNLHGFTCRGSEPDRHRIQSQCDPEGNYPGNTSVPISFVFVAGSEARAKISWPCLIDSSNAPPTTSLSPRARRSRRTKPRTSRFLSACASPAAFAAFHAVPPRLPGSGAAARDPVSSLTVRAVVSSHSPPARRCTAPDCLAVNGLAPSG